jgi:hypothetical protein
VDYHGPFMNHDILCAPRMLLDTMWLFSLFLEYCWTSWNFRKIRKHVKTPTRLARCSFELLIKEQTFCEFFPTWSVIQSFWAPSVILLGECEIWAPTTVGFFQLQETELVVLFRCGSRQEPGNGDVVAHR